MSLPPQTTVVFLDVPEDWLIGIDLHFFESTSQFKGIKVIPDGPHVIHWGADSQSIRTGKFFFAEESHLVICQWDAEEEAMLIDSQIGELNISATKSRLGDYYSFMVQYPDPEASNWSVLTDRITSRVVSNILPELITTSSTSKEENEILLKSLRDSAVARQKDDAERLRKITDQHNRQDEPNNDENIKQDQKQASLSPGNNSIHDKLSEEDNILQSLVDQSFEEIKFSTFDLKKTWKEGAVGRDVTINSLDKSWYLNNVVIKDKYSGVFGSLLGELQLSYILMLIFANFSGAQQWKKIAELLLRCRRDVVDHPQRFIEFFNIVYHQIKACPLEYIDEFLERSFLQLAFGQFRRLLLTSGNDGSQLEPKLKIAPQVKAAADRVFDTLLSSGIPISANVRNEIDSDEEEDDEKPTFVVLPT